MTLYIVATPIGNLGDFSDRARRILQAVDLIAAEDTRHSRKLLAHYQIDTTLTAYHDFSRQEETGRLIDQLLAGMSIALISDAGTPLISDPGYRLVRAAQQAGITVVPVPGASALTAALCAAGLPTDRFRFEGFLPAKAAARQARLEKLRDDTATLVFYESPHRIIESLGDIAAVLGEAREATLARELTKTFEQIVRAPVAVLRTRLGDDIPVKGEFVLVVEGASVQPMEYDEQALMQILLDELPPRRAAVVAQRLTGKSKNALYKVALALRGEQND